MLSRFNHGKLDQDLRVQIELIETLSDSEQSCLAVMLAQPAVARKSHQLIDNSANSISIVSAHESLTPMINRLFDGNSQTDNVIRCRQRPVMPCGHETALCLNNQVLCWLFAYHSGKLPPFQNGVEELL